MERVAALREQATVLRTLARSFDIAPIRNQILTLAQRCDDLAQAMETDPESAGIGSKRPAAGQR
jgi:hypothetical protein